MALQIELRPHEDLANMQTGLGIEVHANPDTNLECRAIADIHRNDAKIAEIRRIEDAATTEGGYLQWHTERLKLGMVQARALPRSRSTPCDAITLPMPSPCLKGQHPRKKRSAVPQG